MNFFQDKRVIEHKKLTNILSEYNRNYFIIKGKHLKK